VASPLVSLSAGRKRLKARDDCCRPSLGSCSVAPLPTYAAASLSLDASCPHLMISGANATGRRCRQRSQTTRLRCERAMAYYDLMELLELAEMPTDLMGTA
jgi:hypothetical protein